MSQRVNRAFYSEPLISFPGRLHITAEKCYVEVLIKEDGKRAFRAFSTEDFNALINLLVEQDFYQDGYELAYENELFEVSKKAKQIKEYLFKDAPQSSQIIYPKKQTITPKHKNNVNEQVAVSNNEHKAEERESEKKENNAKVLLGNIVDCVVKYILDKNLPKDTIDLSSDNIASLNQPLFEQVEYDDEVDINIADEKVSAMTSKYIGKFANLHIPKKNGSYVLDKAVLLMTVISLYDGSTKHQSATIHCNNQLFELFESKWGKYGHNAPHDDIRKTFLTLSDESFWHLNPPNSKGEYSAQIDSGLAVTLSQQKSRSLLRKTLYSRYLK